MTLRGTRSLTVTSAQSAANNRLLGGPIRLCGWSFNDGVAGQGNFADTSAAAPAAGATIASLSLANGVYNVQWWFELTGTPGAGDVDNVSLNIGATQIDQSTNLGAVGNYGPFNAEAVVTGGPLTLAAKAIGAATAGTTYRVRLVVTPVGNSTATIFDGSQAVAFSAVTQGGVDTHDTGGVGVAIDTGISVQATQGIIAGTIWYYLNSDLEGDPPYTSY
jgi:hypothetical protein